jgi:hypothetical protein
VWNALNPVYLIVRIKWAVWCNNSLWCHHAHIQTTELLCGSACEGALCECRKDWHVWHMINKAFCLKWWWRQYQIEQFVSALTTTTTTRSTEDLEVMPYLYDSGTHRYQMSFQGFTVTPWMADSERPKLCCPVKWWISSERGPSQKILWWLFVWVPLRWACYMRNSK